MKVEHKSDYTPRRIVDYPSIGDQLDLIYKGFMESVAKGETLSPSHQKLVDMIKEVKEKYPKSS